MVYVDTAPGLGALDPGFEGVEKPRWESVSQEENLDGLSEAQLGHVPGARRAGAGRRPAPGRADLGSEARCDIPSTFICTGFTAEQYQTYARDETRRRRGSPASRAQGHDLDRPADEPLADVVTPARHRRIIGEVAGAPAGGLTLRPAVLLPGDHDRADHEPRQPR